MRTRGRERLLLILLVAGLLGVPATGARAQGTVGLGIRLAEAPVTGRDDPRAQIYVVDHVSPGSSFTRRVEVTNGSDRPMRPKLYVTGAAIVDGAFAPTDDDGAEVARWATLSPATLEIAPGEAASAELEVTVPDDAEDGEYYGAAFAEAAPAPGGGVAVVGRVGIRIYLSVGAGAPPPSDFEVSTLTAGRLDDGRPYVDAEVANTGERALDMTGELELLDGPAALSAGPFPADLGTTLGPGQTSPVRVVLDEDTPAGPWRAVLTLRSGRLERSVEGEVTFPEEPGTEASPVDAEDIRRRRKVAIPIAAAVLAVVLAGLIAYAVHRRRTRGATT